MKTLEIIGYKRDSIGKQKSKQLRQEGNVPCVLYGGKDHVQFYTPMIMFKDLVYTPDVHVVDLNIEGDHYQCIMQDVQFHPVSEVILHADFLELIEDKEVKINVPVHFVGTSPGVVKGGRLVPKLRYIRIKALPKDLPDFIEVDVSKLELGKSIKIKHLKPENYEILNHPQVSIATVETPRTLRGTAEEVAEAEGEQVE